MAVELPYLTTYKNVGTLFEKIEKARIPDAFTVKFLTDTIGLKGTNDRSLIPLLKKLGFLDNAGKPTPEYSLLKNKQAAKGAIASGIKKAYAPLYAADEKAHELSGDALKGLIAQVSGAEERMNQCITGTFNALVKASDFTAADAAITGTGNSIGNGAGSKVDATPSDSETERESSHIRPEFAPAFRFNIEIHLPSNGTEETYLAIFDALRRSLG